MHEDVVLRLVAQQYAYGAEHVLHSQRNGLDGAVRHDVVHRVRVEEVELRCFGGQLFGRYGEGPVGGIEAGCDAGSEEAVGSAVEAAGIHGSVVAEPREELVRSVGGPGIAAAGIEAPYGGSGVHYVVVHIDIAVHPGGAAGEAGEHVHHMDTVAVGLERPVGQERPRRYPVLRREGDNIGHNGAMLLVLNARSQQRHRHYCCIWEEFSHISFPLRLCCHFHPASRLRRR